MTYNVAAQGDVMLRRLPDDACREGTPVTPEGGYVIITHSETGHHHVMDADAVTLLERPQDKAPEGMEILRAIVSSPTPLVHLRSHDTHAPIMFETGVYEVRHQREYTAEGYRRAQD